VSDVTLAQPPARGIPPAAGSRARARRREERKARWAWRIAGYVTFLAIWQFASTFLVAQVILPAPLTVAQEMWSIVTSDQLVVHFAATLRNIAIGFGTAFVLGTVIGIAMGKSRWWEAFLGDAVMLTLTTPGLVFALVCAMIFGLGALGPIVCVVVTAYSYVAVNVVEGVKAAPRDLDDMARAFGVSRLHTLRHVLLPYLAPFFFTAARYGFSVSWKIATLMEVIVGTKGIGFMMRREFQEFSMEGFLAWVLLFFAFALFLERGVLQWQMNRFYRWRPEVAK
jgi:NitT/TauT family transport system permease protein